MMAEKTGFNFNPVIVKELRSRMRGMRSFSILTVLLGILGLFSYIVYKIMSVNSYNQLTLSAEIGYSLFYVLLMLVLLMISIITPAVTAGAISREQENKTLEMLLATPIKPSSILWGKLLSSLSYVLLLIFAAIPMASLVFSFGGVTPGSMARALLMLIVTTLMIGSMSIMLSAWVKRTIRSMVISYVFLFILMVVPYIAYTAFAILQYQGAPPRWILVPHPIAAIMSTVGTSAGNSSISMVGQVFTGGFDFTRGEAFSNIRPLFHYTLPLYLALTALFYMLSLRFIRPTRTWKLKNKEVAIALASVLCIGAASVGYFKVTESNYSQSNIFTVPTPAPFPDKWIEPGLPPAPIPDKWEDTAIEPPEVEIPDVDNPDVILDTPAPNDPSTDGNIKLEIGLTLTDEAMIYYEVYHSAFYNSELAIVSRITEIAIGLNIEDEIHPEGVTREESAPIQPELVDMLEKSFVNLIPGSVIIFIEELTPELLRTESTPNGYDALVVFSSIQPAEDGTLLVSVEWTQGDGSTSIRTYKVSYQGGSWVVSGEHFR